MIPTPLMRRRRLATMLLAGPLATWMLVFFCLPAIVLFAHSLWRVEAFQIVRSFNLYNYVLVFTDPLYRRALAQSVQVGAATALLVTGLAYALAWSVRFYGGRFRELIVVSIVTASVGSYLARIYAWRTILGASGVVNWTLESLELTQAPLRFLLFNRVAVVLTLANIFLPYSFLPLYANLLAIPADLVRVGRVLGAGPFANFGRVILPLTSAGITASLVYVFIFATGDFAVPSLVGGPRALVAAQVIADQFGAVFNWPLGAALSFAYMATLAIFAGGPAWIVMRSARLLGGA